MKKTTKIKNRQRMVTIHKKVFQKFPKLQIALFYVKGIDNSSKAAEAKHLLEDVEEWVHLTFHKETMKNHYLLSPWSVAQAEFGKQAQHYHTSVERLLHDVLKKKKVATNDTLTTLVRYLSLRHLIPSGIDNYDQLVGDVTFNLSKGRERVGLLHMIKPEALFYHDEKKVLGLKLDFWHSKKTMLQKDTTAALIHFDVLPPIDKEKLKYLVRDAKEVIKTFCGGRLKYALLDRKKNSVKIS